MVAGVEPRTHLVLLPGLDGTEVLFGPLLKTLPEWLSPLVVTYPAHGSGRYEDLLPIVLRAVRSVPHCHVLGWSFSGPLALRAARAEPERVRSVVLAASFLEPPLPWLAHTGPLLTTPAVALLRVLRRLPIWLGRSNGDALRRDKARIFRRVPARTLAARARAIREVDARDDAAACRQPLLYLAAEEDRVVPEHNLEVLRRLRPDLQVATLPGSHMALYSHPALAALAVAGFCSETSQQAATAPACQ